MTTARGGASDALPVITTPIEMIGPATVTENHVLSSPDNSGGVHRQGGTMTTTNSPIAANTADNCVGGTPRSPTAPADRLRWHATVFRDNDWQSASLNS